MPVKLSATAVIAPEKVVEYLLAPRVKNDKSAYFARAGYTQAEWRQLERDLRTQILPRDAELSRRSAYGELYTIRGPLRGPNGRTLQIVSVWIIEHETTRLITVYPAAEEA